MLLVVSQLILLLPLACYCAQKSQIDEEVVAFEILSIGQQPSLIEQVQQSVNEQLRESGGSWDFGVPFARAPQQTLESDELDQQR